MADGEVRVEITGDSSGLEQNLKKASKATEQVTESVNNLEEAAQKSIDSAVDLGTSIQTSMDNAAAEISDVTQEVENLNIAIDGAENGIATLFSKTFTTANDQIKKFSNELSLIDRSLQLNPGNVELLGQKFAALGGQITATRDKLNELKTVEQEFTQKFADGEIGTEQYNAFRREILDTEAALRDLIAAQNDMFDDNGNLRDTTREMENLGDAIDSAGNSTVTFGDLLKANILSEYVREGINKLANAFGDFVEKGVDLASDLQEVQNVVDTTFDSNASKIYAWSDAALKSFGISSLAAQEYNGTMGAMLKSMGLADDAILEMSTSLTGLSGDMASFRNLNVDEAFEKIRAGISGETEPLKQLGINMSVANLEAYALSQGIETAYDKMSQSEQAILRYNYLMSVTADAQGDFAKTSDSYANQQRILQLQVDNLAASLGEKLLPHLNDVVGTVIDKLPQAERTIENIGEILGVATSFVLEHHEAIISLVTAYGTFYGVMKAGTAIQTAVTTVKKLTAATKAAETAQHGMNAAAAANPYVLLASALAAVTVGLITYANTVDSVHNKVKDVNNDVKELKKSTEDNIAASEGEIAVIKDKMEKYEELRQVKNRTAEQEERLKEYAMELQQYMPEGTQLIDEQTGAYNSLADSIDSVTEALKRKATLNAYEEEYTELIKKQHDAEKNLEKAKQNISKFDGYAYGSNPLMNTAFDIAKAELDEALESYKNVSDEIEALDEKIDTLREEPTPSASSDPGKYYREYAEKKKAEADAASKEIAEQLKENAKKMQEEWEKADHDYAVGAISSEQELYAEKKRIWEQYGDASAKERWEYYEELCKYDDDFAAEQKKLAEKNAKEEQKVIADKWDEIGRLNQMGVITDEEAMERRKKFLSEYYPEYSAESHEYYKKIYDDETTLTEKRLDEQKKIVDEGLNDILSRYQQAYDDLEKKRQAYRNKLMSVGGDLFSVDVTEKNGKKTTTYTVNNLEKQLQKMREYHKNIKELKKQGASEALLSEITSLGSEDSAQFAKYLSKMSDSEFAAINKMYNEKQALADELSSELYQGEAKKISDNMTAELEALATNSKDYGQTAAEQFAEGFIESISNNGADAADGYIDAFKSEFEDRAKEFEELFRNTNMAAEIKATVQAETAKYSYAAYTAPVSKEAPAIQSGTPNRSTDIDRLIEGINKPIQIVLDGRVIAEAVMQYNGEYKRRSGG